MHKPLYVLLTCLSIAAMLLSLGGSQPVAAQAAETNAKAPRGTEDDQEATPSNVPPGYLTGPNADDPAAIALAYLHANKAAYGLADTDLADLYVSRQYTDAHNGLTHLYFVQRWQGIEIFNAVFNFNIDQQGRILFVGNRFVPNLARTINTTTPTLTAQQAVIKAAQHLGLQLSQALQVKETLAGPTRDVLFSSGGLSQDDIPVKLIYDASAKGTRLTWNIIINELSGQHWWNIRVDAATGEVVSQNDWVVSENWGTATDAPTTATQTAERTASTVVAPSMPITPVADGSSYKVYAWPVESPNHTSPIPPADGRTTENQPADALGSPYGWHDTNGAAGAESTLTIGNNVQAYLDLADDDIPTIPGDFPADGGASLDFVFTLDLTLAPSAYRPAAVTNLFYWNNLIHDISYRYGFNEVSGNFQENNYGNGGVGSDSVNAEAQDGGGTDNANFATPSDGINPRMQMYLWTLTTPNRDGDVDNGIIAHEYGHGISNRLTGNSVNCLGNAEQMGEGWSDWQTIFMTLNASEDFVTGRGIGTYALGEPVTGGGIRPAKYSTALGVNNYTYADLGSMAVPHGVGFVWNTMLYEMMAALVTEHGLNPDLYGAWNTGGNNLAYQLVTDGMKIQPCSPGFVDGRNAILAADTALTGGANQCIIWGAFAKRGLGFSASQGSVNSTTDGVAAFDLPSACEFGEVPPEVEICQGQNAIYPVQIGGAFTAPVTMTISGNPAPSATDFNPNPVLTVPSTTTLTVSNTGSVAAGAYTLTITATDAITFSNFSTLLNVFASAPGAPTLNAPANGAANIGLQPDLQWSGTNGTSYLVQVATDAAFTTVVYSQTVSGNAHTLATPLNGSTTYYWRVTASNACGASSASATFSFTTVAMFCAAPNVAINDNTIVTSTLTIPNAGLLLDVDISINGTHTWVGDLSFVLTHGLTSVTLVDRPGYTGSGFGCNANDFDPTLNDEGTDGPVESQCRTSPTALFGSPTPNNPLSAFDNGDLNGVWTLAVGDAAGGDTGVLEQWCVVPTLAITYGVDLAPPSQAVTTTNGSPITYTLMVTNTGNFPDTYTVTVSGNAFTTTTPASVGPLNPGQSAALEVVVNVPSNAAGNTSDVATVTATSQGDGVTNASATLTTTVAPTYGVILSPVTQAITATAGSLVTHTLSVTNTGNLPDTFTVTVSGNIFTTTVPASVGPLNPGQSATLDVVVTVPGNALGNTNDVVTVTVTSQGDGVTNASAVLTTTVASSYGVLLSPATQALTATAGSLVTYTVMITNIGTLTDAFTVTVSGNVFTTTAPAAVGPLAPGASTTFDVMVTVPGNALGNTSDVVTVTATSQGDGVTNASATLTTTVAPTYGVLLNPATQALTATAGSLVTYTVMITNTGNLLDTFTVTVSGNAFTTTVPAAVGPLAPGASTTFDVVVTLGASGSDTATITVTSQGNGTATANVTVTSTVALYKLYLPLIRR